VPDARPARAWHVFATYGAAVAGIVAMTILAIELLRSAYPDVPDAALVRSLPGLLAGALAASSGLLLTLAIVVRPLSATRLRLRPGRETGPVLAVMVLGILALSQALDSATRLMGLAEHGSLALVGEALAQARGAELLAAVVVLGLVAGGAEEVFFRGYMQWRLREHWSARAAVLATSVCFALLHGDVTATHAVAALVLGLYLGFVAETSGSTLPAIVCHAANNVVYTLQTALGVAPAGREGHLAAVAVGIGLCAACVLWVWRAAPPPPAA